MPYLGVKQSFSPEDAAGKTVILEDLTGLTADEARNALKNIGLTAELVGQGDRVTGQLPAAGSSVPGNSQVLLYLGEVPTTETVTVPDFTGMNRAQAAEAAGKLGLYILVKGNQSVGPEVTVSEQSVPGGTTVERGTTITLLFTDKNAVD